MDIIQPARRALDHTARQQDASRAAWAAPGVTNVIDQLTVVMTY
jgi:osmotically-inducible protein OsmY